MTDMSNDDRRLGVVLIVTATFLLAFCDALIKYLSDALSLWQLFVLAPLVSLPLLTIRLIGHAGLAALRPISVKWLALRSLLLLAMWILFYAALPWIPLTVAAVGIYTSPLFIALLAFFSRDERPTPRAWIAIILGFVGVLVALRPGGALFTPVMLLPVAAAFCYAWAMVLTRRHCAGERPQLLALGLNLSFLLAGVLGSIGSTITHPWPASQSFITGSWQAVDLFTLLLIVLYGLLMVTINTSVANAYQIAPSSLVGTFDYTYLPFAAAWGWLLFDEVPDLPILLGIALIMASGYLAMRPSSQPRTI